MKSSTIWLAFIWQCNLNILSYLILGTTLKWWYFVSLFLRLEYWSLERLINTPFLEPRFEFICLAQSPNAYPLNHTICVFVIQLCLTLCDPMDCSLPGSSLHGIPKANILEWVLIPYICKGSQILKVRIWNTCTPVVDSCWCMAKPIQYCKVISL